MTVPTITCSYRQIELARQENPLNFHGTTADPKTTITPCLN